MGEAGIDRRQVYVTNAVKHFKFVWRGKRRLHQSPTSGEIDTCRFWLDGERAVVRPQLILTLGTSAARGVIGKSVTISKSRGHPIPLDDGAEAWVTAHPSYLLRLRDEMKEQQERLFRADLAAVAERMAELAEAP
jgi:DNA polymerase